MNHNVIMNAMMHLVSTGAVARNILPVMMPPPPWSPQTPLPATPTHTATPIHKYRYVSSGRVCVCVIHCLYAARVYDYELANQYVVRKSETRDRGVIRRRHLISPHIFTAVLPMFHCSIHMDHVTMAV